MSALYTEEFASGRLLRQFERTGGAGRFTDAFGRLPASEQECLRARAGLQQGEVPVLACVLGDESWTLLTSRRLVWRDGGNQHELPWEDIQDATIDGNVVMTRGSQAKRELSELKVVTTGGDTRIVQLEPGPPFFGFWNAMKLVARIGERRKRARVRPDPG